MDSEAFEAWSERYEFLEDLTDDIAGAVGDLMRLYRMPPVRYNVTQIETTSTAGAACCFCPA